MNTSQILAKNFLIAVLLIITGSSNIALAQTVMDPLNTASKLAVTQLGELDLPAPGIPLNVSAYSFDSLHLDAKVRAVYVRDGELLDVFLPPARLGNNGRPEYILTLPSPVTDLSYQFFRYNLDGSITQSEKINVNRNCLPKVDYKAESYETDTRDAREKILNDARKANALEKELTITDAAIALIDEIKQITADE